MLQCFRAQVHTDLLQLIHLHHEKKECKQLQAWTVSFSINYGNFYRNSEVSTAISKLTCKFQNSVQISKIPVRRDVD